MTGRARKCASITHCSRPCLAVGRQASYGNMITSSAPFPSTTSSNIHDDESATSIHGRREASPRPPMRYSKRPLPQRQPIWAACCLQPARDKQYSASFTQHQMLILLSRKRVILITVLAAVLASVPVTLVLGFAVDMDGVAHQVPVCLDRSQTIKYGWRGPADENVSKVKRPLFSLFTLEYGLWTSSNLTTMAAAYLLQDVIGVPTVLVGYPSQEGGFRRMATGASDAVLEMWSSDMGALVTEYVTRRGVVEQLGSLWYTGQISWYLPQAIADAHPHLILNSWRSLRDPAFLALLPLANSTLPGRDEAGNYLCQETWCTDGVFVPPWCTGPNAVICREVYMPIPDYNKGENEQRIVSLALPLTIVYLGTDRFMTTIEACITSMSTNSTCLFYYWTPDPLLAGHGVVKLHFEEPEPRCWDRFNASLVLPANGGSYLACDWPVEFLGKMARSSLRHDQPALREFLQLFTLDAADMSFMMESHPTPSDIADRACAWVKGCETKWSSMIPPPMSVRSYLSARKYSPLPTVTTVLFAFLLVQCVSSTVILWWFRRKPSLRVQSPGTLIAMTVGAGFAGVGIAFPYLVTPHAAGTCRASSTLTEIGLAVALAGILAKAWRLYLVFFNPNVAFVMFSRLVRISVSDKALVALGSTVIAVSTILAMLAVSTSTTMTEFVDIDVSTTSFVTICAPLTPSTSAARASVVFRLLLAVSTAGIAFRVRSAFTIAGDARNAWSAAAALAPVCILTATVRAIVLPLLTFDPIDSLVADLVGRLILSIGLVASVAMYAVRPAMQVLAGLGVEGAIVARGARTHALVTSSGRVGAHPNCRRSWFSLRRRPNLKSSMLEVPAVATAWVSGQWSHLSLPDDNDFIQAAGESGALDVPATGGGSRIVVPTLGQVGGGDVPSPSAATPISPIVVVSDTATESPCDSVPRIVPVTVVSWPDAASLLTSSPCGFAIVGMVGQHMAVRRVGRARWGRLWSCAIAPWVNVTVLLVMQSDLTGMEHLLVMVPTAKNVRHMYAHGAATILLSDVESVTHSKSRLAAPSLSPAPSPSSSPSMTRSSFAAPSLSTATSNSTNAPLSASIPPPGRLPSDSDARQFVLCTRDDEYVVQAGRAAIAEHWVATLTHLIKPKQPSMVRRGSSALQAAASADRRGSTVRMTLGPDARLRGSL
ncbi:hypothetical protein AMAG_17607 [Allomyces macrogynus ATCC 38327]|uniref:G-protein coupled receptors family 3 profile domain-containing protein n=1 Tax=Allomyces macrogynus (strain ATCC 38327) TaxID=578462 RepID=A0A0L0RUI6_ALLM3|nr:hypothetical protein AMAG_17607 [Allomyces macrogynus ATCC 38327]|eukprot:KNE54022.1 hypothetical protein AMAG_17607 [Allomyces macrogynus ATCC 38327]